jgi:hypothetical protein
MNRKTEKAIEIPYKSQQNWTRNSEQINARLTNLFVKAQPLPLSLPLLLNGTEPADVTARVFVEPPLS